MPKEVVQYECDHCGTVYNTKPKAAGCEETHYKPIKVINSVFRNGDNFPEKLEVVFEKRDGKGGFCQETVPYVLKDSVNY